MSCFQPVEESIPFRSLPSLFYEPRAWSVECLNPNTTDLFMAKRSRSHRQNHILEQILHPDAAGIDIGATEMVVAVPFGRDEESVRSFGTMTPDLHELRDWLLACGITSVAMESTGIYWLPLFEILQAAGLEVILVNASHVKHCPARKTDVQDAQWLMQLHTAGLLSGSFHPPEEIRTLRGLMRERSDLVKDSSRQLLRMQKGLSMMNIQLHEILSDLAGQSGQRIIEAILAGERDAERLWSLRDKRCRTSGEEALKALTGHWDEEVVARLGRRWATWKHLQTQIETVDECIERRLSDLEGELDERFASVAVPKRRRLNKGEIPCDVRGEAYRLYGVDLGAIPGVSTQVLATLLSEVGSRRTLLASFGSDKHFSSWLGLCPHNRKSGGSVLSSQTRRVANRLATALRLSAQALWRDRSHLGGWCRKMKARLGKAEGITATAHRIARLIYNLAKKQQPYDDGQVAGEPVKLNARTYEVLQKQAARHGMKLVVNQQA